MSIMSTAVNKALALAHVRSSETKKPAHDKIAASASVDGSDELPLPRFGAQEAIEKMLAGEQLHFSQWSPEEVLETFQPNEILPVEVREHLDALFGKDSAKGGFGPINSDTFLQEVVRPALEMLGIGPDDIIPFMLVLTESVMSHIGHNALSVHDFEMAGDSEHLAKGGSKHDVRNPVKDDSLPDILAAKVPLPSYVVLPDMYRQGSLQFGMNKVRMTFGIPLPGMYPDIDAEGNFVKRGTGVRHATADEMVVAINDSLNRIDELHAKGEARFVLIPNRPARLVMRVKGYKLIVNCARFSNLPLVDIAVSEKARMSPVGNMMDLKDEHGENFAYVICEPIGHANPPGRKEPKTADVESAYGSVKKALTGKTTKRVRELAPNDENAFARVYVPSDVYSKERYMLHLEVLNPPNGELN